MTSRAKRILITGGAGFLGSHLCEVLLRGGHEVICLDNFSTGHESNIAHLLGQPNFELVRHDVTEPIDREVDEIYNLACPASPEYYQTDPIRTMKISLLGAIHILELAQRRGAKVLQASTSEVYGDPDVHPQPETYRGLVNPVGPRACYNEGKRAVESLFMDYRRMYKLPVRIVRIFNTYGPGMHPFDGRVVSTFIRQALSDRAITIFGDGSQTRSFCFRDDLTDGLIRMMGTDREFPGPVNLGNPNEISMSDLAQTICRIVGPTENGQEPPIAYRPLPEDDPRRRCPDISLAKKTLGWEPTVSLEQGLRQTVDWFRSIDFETRRTGSMSEQSDSAGMLKWAGR